MTLRGTPSNYWYTFQDDVEPCSPDPNAPYSVSTTFLIPSPMFINAA